MDRPDYGGGKRRAGDNKNKDNADEDDTPVGSSWSGSPFLCPPRLSIQQNRSGLPALPFTSSRTIVRMEHARGHMHMLTNELVHTRTAPHEQSVDPGEWKSSGDNEAIRQRRRVTVRRGGQAASAGTATEAALTAEAPAPPTASSNPFAGVSLTPPAPAPANPFSGVSLVAPSAAAPAPAASPAAGGAEVQVHLHALGNYTDGTKHYAHVLAA